MPSFGKCAALAAGLLGAVMASPHRHAERAIHQKKDANAQWYGYGTPSTDNEWFREGVLQGQNPTEGAIAVNSTTGAYVVNVVNSRTDSDMDLVIWTASGMVGMYTALTINVHPANVTVKVAAGENVSISFNPALYTEANGYPGGLASISGAMCGMYNDTPVAFFGGCYETLGEFTFADNSYFSTVDVSRLVNMNGANMTMTTYAEQGAEPACVSDMETCVYKCADGAQTCIAGTCSECEGNTGCMGMGPTSGYVQMYIG